MTELGNAILYAGILRSAQMLPAIAAVLLIRKLWRRLPGNWRYLLCIMVFLGLAVPFRVKLQIKVAKQSVQEKQVDAGTPGDFAEATVRTVAFAPSEKQKSGGMLLEKARDLWSAGIVSFVWLAGMLLLAGIQAARYLRLRRRLADAVWERTGVFESDKIETPLLMGIFSPAIYLPVGMNEQEKRCVMIHEQTHRRRGDVLVKLLAFLTACWYWWNPAVWLMYRALAQDMELACDEAVLEQKCFLRTVYAQTLLEQAKRNSRLAGCMEFAEGNIKERVEHILKKHTYKKMEKGCFAAISLMVGVLAAVQPGIAAQEDAALPENARVLEKNIETVTVDAQELAEVMEGDAQKAEESGGDVYKEEWNRLSEESGDMERYGLWMEDGVFCVRMNGALESEAAIVSKGEELIERAQKVVDSFEELEMARVYIYGKREKTMEFKDGYFLFSKHEFTTCANEMDFLLQGWEW